MRIPRRLGRRLGPLARLAALALIAGGGAAFGVGCGSASTPSGEGTTKNPDASPTTSADAAGHPDSAPADAGPGADTATAPADASGDTGPTLEDSSTDDAPIFDSGASPLMALPPPGSSMCAHGTFTQAEAMMACMTPSFALDDMPLPDGGTATIPRSCSAVTISDGEWEVWCSPMSAYVWVRFNNLTNANVLQDCHHLSLLLVDEGVYDTGSGGGNGAQVGTYELDGGEISGTVPGMPQIGIYQVTLPSTPDASQAGANLFVLGSLEDSCGMGPQDPPTVLTGIGVKW